MIGIVDPPRPEARVAIAECKSAGIQVRMITGDHAVTAAAIGRELGIGGRALTGAEFAAMSDETLLHDLPDIGVIARVAPEDKIRLVQLLQHQENIVAMTGDGVNDAPALKKADIGVAMGITGTEVSKEAAVMILTDDNFATIVGAVEKGRALYDNLMRYIRFQMAVLFGYIVLFLGSSVLDLLSGVPFLPLQTLYINFTVQVFLAVGLGYGKAREGLMNDAPRPPEQKILPRRLMTWLIVSGAVMGGLTLGIIWWATPIYGDSAARTMALVAFSIANIWFALETADEEHSIINFDVILANPTLLKTVGLSAVAILLATELNIFHRILDTVSLTIDQWAICFVVSLAMLIVAEGRKLLGIHTTEPARLAAVPPAPVPAS